jgi:fluoroquinolone resistance protein
VSGKSTEDIQSDNKEHHGQCFESLNLAGEELRDKNFFDCEFAHCNFSESKLLNCKFDGCRFTDSNLSTAKIKGSAFREVIFKSCKLVGIDWTSARWPSVSLTGQVEFDECILNSSSFFGLYLQELKLEACQAHDVDFTEADCEHASFIQTDFANSTFHQTKLMKADFTDASNYQIDIATNKITGAKFSLPEAVSLLHGLQIEIVE